SDEEAFEALFTAEYARVVGIANRVLADPHEAEDVAQEIFIDFHRLHSATAEYAPAWLHRAAAHASLNRLRGARRRQKREFAQALEAEDKTLDPQKQAEVAEDRRRLRDAPFDVDKAFARVTGAPKAQPTLGLRFPILRPAARPTLALVAAVVAAAVVVVAFAFSGFFFKPATVKPVPVTVADIQALSQLADYGTITWTKQPDLHVVTSPT